MNTSRALLILAFALGMLFDAVAVPALTPLAQAAQELFVARVNGVGIPAEDYLQLAAEKTPADGVTLSMDERVELVDGLIDEELLYREALRLGIDKDPKVRKVMVNALLRDQVYNNVSNADFTDAELEAYFNAHMDDFIVPEKVQIGTIVVAIGAEHTDAQAKALANDLYRQALADPDAFRELATAHSEDPYARRGGDVGFVSREGKPGLDSAIVETAFSLAVGQIASPVRTSNGYVVVKSINRREAVERTFAQMKGSVLRAVKNERLKVLYDDYVAALRRGANIRIDRGVLSTLEVAASPSPPTSFPGLLDETDDP